MEGGPCYFHANPDKASEPGKRGGRAKGPTASPGAEYIARPLKSVASTRLIQIVCGNLRTSRAIPRFLAVRPRPAPPAWSLGHHCSPDDSAGPPLMLSPSLPRASAYRDSFVSGCRGSITASGRSRCISFCKLACTASRSSNECIRSVRPRSSPGVCGPRSRRTQRTAVSPRDKFNTPCNRCSYLVTRLSAPLAGPARLNSCNPHSRPAT